MNQPTSINHNNSINNHQHLQHHQHHQHQHHQQQQQQQQHQHQQQQQQITGTSLDEPADCTIACDEGHITAHKLVLCDHSKYLHDILIKYPTAEHPIIILTDLNIIDIKTLVNYMYTGELIITNDSSPASILRAAQILKIDSLTTDDSEEPIDEEEDDGMVEWDDENSSSVLDPTTIDDNNDGNIDDHTTTRLINSIKNIYSLDQTLSNFEGPATGISSNDANATNKNNKIRCHLCNIGLSDVKCLYRHVLTRHLPEKWGYKCEFCDREFSRDDHLMRHYTTKHKNMEFNREKIRETRRLNREMAKNFHDQISTV